MVRRNFRLLRKKMKAVVPAAMRRNATIVGAMMTARFRDRECWTVVDAVTLGGPGESVGGDIGKGSGREEMGFR